METAEELSLHDKVLAVIVETRDGEDLAPRDLGLTELVLNDLATSAQVSEFDALYERVCVKRTYAASSSWLAGVEGVSQDHRGYVYWRGACIEHFSPVPAPRLRELTLKLQEVCLGMERHGLTPNNSTIYLNWAGVMSAPRPLAEGFVVGSLDELRRLTSQERPGGEGYTQERVGEAEAIMVWLAAEVAKFDLAAEVKAELVYRQSCRPAVLISVDARPQGGAQALAERLRSRLVATPAGRGADQVVQLVAKSADDTHLGVLVNARYVRNPHADEARALLHLVAALRSATKVD